MGLRIAYREAGDRANDGSRRCARRSWVGATDLRNAKAFARSAESLSTRFGTIRAASVLFDVPTSRSSSPFSWRICASSRTGRPGLPSALEGFRHLPALSPAPPGFPISIGQPKRSRVPSILRDELLSRELLYSLAETKYLNDAWRQHFNEVRLPRSLGYRPPARSAILPLQPSNSLREVGLLTAVRSPDDLRSDRKSALIVATTLLFFACFRNGDCARHGWIGSRVGAHIIETGTESFRSRRTMEKRQKKG